MKQESNESLNSSSPTINYERNFQTVTNNEFDPDEEETLIFELKHRYQLIWDANMVEYKNNELRRKAWSLIGKKLNKDVDACKKKWKQLRGNFCKAQLKFERDNQVPVWKYYKMLTFLSTVISHKKNSSLNDIVNMIESNASVSLENNNNLLSDLPPQLLLEEDAVSYHHHQQQQQQHQQQQQQQQQQQHLHNYSNVDLDYEINNFNSNHPLLIDQSLSSTTAGAAAPPASKRPKFMILDKNNYCEMIKDGDKNEDVLFGESIGKSLEKYPRLMRTKIKIEILRTLHKADELMNQQQE